MTISELLAKKETASLKVLEYEKLVWDLENEISLAYLDFSNPEYLDIDETKAEAANIELTTFLNEIPF